MSETTQEPVIEQTDESMELEVGSEVNQNVPVNSKVEDESAEMETLSVNYLDVDLFDNIRKVSIEELLHLEVTEEVPQEEQDRYLSTFSDISEREIITGRVIGMNEKEILIDIGFKSEGIIKRDEFAEDALPEVGEKLDVYLERMEDESGKTVLSKEKADFLRRWTKLREIHETGEIISGRIVRRIKGGMVVDLDGVQAFLPGSQIDVRPVKDFDKYIDTDMDLRVVKFNEFRKNVVVSHKAILEESLAVQRDELFNKLEIGSIMEGRVKNITDFGVFIDLGGIDGLLHITDLSWGRVNHPSELIGLDDSLTVKIIDFDKDKNINEFSATPPAYSSTEAQKHVDRDLTIMSKFIGKASQQVIKTMMDGVKSGKYDAMDLARGIQTGPTKRTHYGEDEFIQQLWTKVRDGFRRYSKRGKLR